MVDPLFWLGLSILLVAVSITAVLMAALPAFRELSRAARSAEKLFDTLHRELPPTLEAIRLTSMEITELTDDMTEGMQNVGRMTQQVDEGVTGVRQQAKQAQITTRSVVAGVKAALGAFVRPQRRKPVPLRPGLPAAPVEELEDILEDIDEAAEPELLEAEAPPAEQHSVQAEHVRFEAELPRRAALPVSNEPDLNAPDLKDAPGEKAVAAEVNSAQPTLRNGKSHPAQLRASSSPPVNVSPAALPEKPPLPIESQQQS